MTAWVRSGSALLAALPAGSACAGGGPSRVPTGRYGSPMCASTSGETRALRRRVEQATRLEFAGGVTAKLTANWSLYAQGGYQFAAGEPSNDIRRDGVMGDVGMRYNW